MFQKKLNPKGVLCLYKAMIVLAYKDRDSLIRKMNKKGKANFQEHKNFETAVDFLSNLQDLQDILNEIYGKDYGLPVFAKDITEG